MAGNNEATRGEYSCRLLGADDWRAYRQIRLTAWAENHDDKMLQQETARDEASWRKEFDGNVKIFGLFRGNEIIGSSGLRLIPEENRANYSGSYISLSYRGKGLADLFYASRLDYLKGVDGIDKITTEIWKGNEKSIAAAERNGFKNVGIYDPENKRVEGQSYLFQRAVAEPQATTGQRPRPTGFANG
jgi:RimJ/RimL family protein N-acetyltransferase